MTGLDEHALDSMQHGPHAHRCPRGHGPLGVRTDATSPSALSLICDTCGHRVAADYALIGRALAGAPASRSSTPRGLRPDGTVRTTGWLQVGGFPVSSGVWAAMAAFVLGWFFFSPLVAVLALPVGYGLWKLWTTLVFPASRAVNTELAAVADLEEGQWVRLYGTAGPVGQVVHLAGSAERVWLVDLLD